jgi:hypothetical protein
MRYIMSQLVGAILHDEKQGNITTRLRKCAAIINEAEDIKAISSDDAHFVWVAAKQSARRIATHARCHNGKELQQWGLAA